MRVEGDFTKGVVVSLVDQQGDEFARGLTNYDATSTRDIAGKRTDDVTKSIPLRRSHPPRQPPSRKADTTLSVLKNVEQACVMFVADDQFASFKISVAG